MIYFVDPAGGDDANDGLSDLKPFRSISHAIKSLVAGDTLRLHAGSVYRGTTAFPSAMAGTSAAPIVVEPYAGGQVIFDGGITLPDLSGASNEK